MMSKPSRNFQSNEGRPHKPDPRRLKTRVPFHYIQLEGSTDVRCPICDSRILFKAGEDFRGTVETVCNSCKSTIRVHK